MQDIHDNALVAFMLAAFSWPVPPSHTGLQLGKPNGPVLGRRTNRCWRQHRFVQPANAWPEPASRYWQPVLASTGLPKEKKHAKKVHMQASKYLYRLAMLVSIRTSIGHMPASLFWSVSPYLYRSVTVHSVPGVHKFTGLFNFKPRCICYNPNAINWS